MATRPIKIGIDLLAGEGGFAGAQPRWKRILALAQLVENTGFDSLWMPDHLLLDRVEILEHFGHDVPDEMRNRPPQGWWDSWMLLSAIAASTERITIGPLVSCTSYRNPALVAKMATTFDEISNGRLVLGLGAGDAPSEFAAFGWPYDHLVGRFEDAATIIHQLLKTGTSNHPGRFFQTVDCALRPAGPRASGPPVLISAKGPRMLDLAARFADIWNAWIVFDRSHPEAARPLLVELDRACERIGRDPDSLERTLGVAVDLPGDYAVDENAISGSDHAIAEQLAAFAEIGISQLQVLVRPTNRASLERFARVLELLDR